MDTGPGIGEALVPGLLFPLLAGQGAGERDRLANRWEGRMTLRDYWIAGSPPPDGERERAEGGPCGEHGCVGPFVNQVYQRGLGEGTAVGDCMECGRRVIIRPSDRGFESIGRLVEAIIPPATQS